jgi:hypothetical protein
MARKTVADQAKAKAEKQKKMVIVLGVVLAGALAYGVHTMMALNSGGGSKPVAAPATTTGTSTPAPAATPPAAPTLSGVPATGTSTPASSGSISGQLVSAVQAPANVGQLQSFSLFESKDPFNAGGPSAPKVTTSSGGGTSSKGSGGTSKPPKAPPAPPTPPPTSAVISVNGSGEMVAAGANFPAANPMFQLVSLTDTTAKVAVAGGSYASGAPTLTLKVNVPVTLVNTADGTRYTLELYPQGTVPATGSSSSSSGTTTMPATTTTTTTTTSG